MPGCLSDADARDFVSGRLTGLHTRVVEQHLDACTTCLRLVADAAEKANGVPRPIEGMDTLPGFRGTERFQVIRRVGQGGMGAVYEAYDRESDSLVALKTLQQMDGHSLYRFKKEFRELADVRHPNLLRLGELHFADDRWFFTMELVRGHSFIEHVRHSPRVDSEDPTLITPGPPTVSRGEPATMGESYELGEITEPPRVGDFDEPRLRDALRQLAQAVGALHDSGRIHRDIKPGNILVNEQGRVVLLDFGLIQRFRGDDEGGSRETDQGMVGTPAYMAPEQATGAAIGPAADWYAVGIVLFEALTGKVPFSGPTLKLMLEKQQRPAMSIRHLITDVPEDLDQLVQELLRANPAERPVGAEILERLGADASKGFEATPINAEATLADRRLDQPVRLIGRERELAVLSAGLAACETGKATSVLVLGEPGIGKTAMVDTFLERARAHAQQVVILRGRCYEQESLPFNAFDGIVDSLSHYLKQLDEVSAATLLPPNIQLLAGMFPVLRRVPVVSRVPLGRRRIDNPEQLRREAFAVLRQLLESLASRVPLVLFADDLQWADQDSLALLEALLAPPDAPPLLLIATLRSSAGNGGDGASAHALPEPLRAHFTELRIGRLGHDESALLLARLLSEIGEAGALLAPALLREAGGHPLYLQEVVRFAATRAGFDAHVQLEDILVERVAGLDEPARRLMEILAIAGVPLTVDVVASTAEMPRPECVRWLRTLRAAQLVRADGFGIERTVQTFHDRVREAIVTWLSHAEQARFSIDELARIHLRIGRHLRDQASGAGGLAGAVFRVVQHLNLGVALIDDPDEWRELIELNLQAGRMAMQSTAYESALLYLDQAVALLAAHGERADDELELAVERELMACAHLAGHIERATTIYRGLLERCRSVLDKAEVMLLWVQLATSVGRFHEAIETARTGLRLLDVSLPAHSGKTAILAEQAQVRWHLGRRKPQDLDRLAETSDPRVRAALELLVALGPAAFFVDIPLMVIAAMRVVVLSLKHGISSVSAHGLAGYGVSLVGFGKPEEAYAFGQLALRVNQRFGEQRITGKLLMLNGTYLTPWVRPFAEARQQLDEACVAALRDGDLAYEAYAAATRAIITYCDAPDLDSVQTTAESARVIAASRRDSDMSAIGAAIARYCVALRGPGMPAGLALPGSSDADFRASLDEARVPTATLYYFLLNAELAHGFGQLGQAELLLREAAQRLDRAFSIASTVEYHLLAALLAAELHDSAGWSHRIGHTRTVARSLKLLARWARSCPANFEAGFLIVRAESERIAGHVERATQGYEAALHSARTHHQPRREGLALELAARHAHAHDRGAAAAYARAAMAIYERWGASAKVDYLRRGFAAEPTASADLGAR